MRYGENALATIERVKKKLEELKARGCRRGRDRRDLRSLRADPRAVDNLKEKLVEELHRGGALVCWCSCFTCAPPSSPSSRLPLGILAAFIVMQHQGINANIMSLGGIAIAIGAMVDAAIVMIENAHKHLERYREPTVSCQAARSTGGHDPCRRSRSARRCSIRC
jgi:Cu(I)/Ag(I) efflux system membrane protein CusA/SilA